MVKAWEICHLPSLDIYSELVKSNRKANGVILFCDSSSWWCQKKHICKSYLHYQDIWNEIVFWFFFFFCFGNRNFYWGTQMNNFKNFNQIPTVLIFCLVFKGLSCWKDHREIISLYFFMPSETPLKDFPIS